MASRQGRISPPSLFATPAATRWRARLATALLTVGLSAGAGAAETRVTVDLGEHDQVVKLFSYPNCGSGCQDPATLQQTVKHYLDMSVQRDGYGRDKVKVWQDGNGHVLAGIRAYKLPRNYGERVKSFLSIGQVGYQGWTALPQKADDWRFFLPLGLPLRNHPTVQLLHFPPDTVLTVYHDYLKAKTTERWAGLLRENGASYAQSQDFQSIVDIAPIAAPASAGTQLTGTYQYFNDYITALIESWTRQDGRPAQSAPMVAFGDPARAWLCGEYKPQGCQDGGGTSSLPILGLTSIQLKDGRSVAVLGANHPSRFFYYYQDHPDEALAIMQQDLVASCWEATLGRRKAGEPAGVLNACQAKWPPGSPQVKAFYDAYVKTLQQQKQASGQAQPAAQLD